MRNVRTICVTLTLIALAGSAIAQSSNVTFGTNVPTVTVTTGDSTTSVFHIFNSSNTELFRVQANGYVGIGTPNAVANLDVRGANAHALVGSGTSDFLGSGQTGFGASNGTEKMFLGAQPALTFLGSVSNTNLGFVTNNSTKMLVDTAGNVGIGTMSPGAKLEVVGNGRFGSDFIEMPNPQYGGIQIGEFGGGATGELQFMSCNCGLGYGYRLMGNAGDASLRLERRANSQAWSDLMSFNAGTNGCDTNGCVGIGTTSPTSYLQIGSTYPARFEDSATSGILNGVVLDMAANSEIHIGGIQIGKTAMPVIQTTGGAGASPLQLNQYSDNDVIIGSNSSAHGLLVKSLPNAVSSFAGSVTVAQSLTVTGTVYANYQDVAEWVPAAHSMPAGTVVVISDDANNTVTASMHAYDTAVAGVVSPSPGLLLGVGGESKAKIATTGRVTVRVDATKGPIRKGDLLVTSDRPGMAMKSEPLDLGGTKIHRPGTLIGKALEPLAEGEGEILVLLSLQ